MSGSFSCIIMKLTSTDSSPSLMLKGDLIIMTGIPSTQHFRYTVEFYSAVAFPIIHFLREKKKKKYKHLKKAYN